MAPPPRRRWPASRSGWQRRPTPRHDRGSTVDAAGNYVEGHVTAYLGRSDGSYYYEDNGTFDFALEDGAYKTENTRAA